MKKTVQIVTIPLNKQGFSINDLIKKPALGAAGEVERWKISYYGMSTGIWQAQQLLVLSDEEIQEEDKFIDGFNKVDTYITGEFKPNKSCKKIIASYPHIEGTLPISKETIQVWIDAGTPEEGVVEKDIDCQAYYGYGGHDCHQPCDCRMLYKKIEYPYSGDVYPKNNILLSFPIAVTDEDIFNAAKKLGQTVEDIRSGKLVIESAGIKEEDIYDAVADYRENHPEKLSIPTDEEIEKKAESFAKMKSIYPSAQDDTHYGYIHGYKQALKDLGYE